MCTSDNAVVVSSMTQEIKRGTVMRFKKRFFGKNWREGVLALHEDSTLVFYPNPDSSSPDIGVRLKDAPEMIAISQYASNVPHRPDFPDGFDITTVMAIGSRSKKHVHWFLFKSEEELIDWMKAIGGTLPPPPQPPPQKEQQHQQNGPPAQPYNPQSVPPPPPGYSRPNPPPYSGPPAPPGYYGQHQPYQGRSPYHGGGQQGQNTVIIRDRDNGGGGGYGGGGMGNFASGMMVGALAGGLTGWGLGYGFGYPRFGWGYGGWGGGGFYDHDTHIHNEHNTYNIVNNDNDVTNNHPENGDNGVQDGQNGADPETVGGQEVAQEVDPGMVEDHNYGGLYEGQDVYGQEGYADGFGYDDVGGGDFFDDGGMDFGGGMDMDFGDGGMDMGDF